MGFWSAFLSRLPVVGVKITVFAIVGHPRNLVRKFFNFEKYQMANGRRRLGKKSFDIEMYSFFVIKREIQSKRLLLRYFFWTYLKPILQKERNTNNKGFILKLKYFTTSHGVGTGVQNCIKKWQVLVLFERLLISELSFIPLTYDLCHVYLKCWFLFDR